MYFSHLLSYWRHLQPSYLPLSRLLTLWTRAVILEFSPHPHAGRCFSTTRLCFLHLPTSLARVCPPSSHLAFWIPYF